MDPTTQKNIDDWLSGPYSEESKNEIEQLKASNFPELVDRFYRHLSFGTGGLRGLMGVGTNRMNIYTVRAATQGLANYIRSLSDEEHPAIVIGYDSRTNSRLFAEETAKVLLGNNLTVYLYEELRPVPLVSFAVRHLKAQAGVMITASHNPPEYNGYKVYWDDGSQVLPPHDTGIIEAVGKIHTPDQVKQHPLEGPLFHTLKAPLDEAYGRAVAPLALFPEQNRESGKELSLVYTSLHGAGSTVIPPLLKEWGFTNLHLVAKQCTPDGTFPTVASPNPEEPAALQMGIEKLKEVEGDLLLATDPDTDRLGAVVLDQGSPRILNGNELAALMAEYLLTQSKKLGRLPSHPAIVKTIVTSELCREVASHLGAECIDLLTGFKYIGQQMTEWEKQANMNPQVPHYIFGCEESFGYLYGTHVRDKDAVISSLLLAEMALFYKKEGKTLYDHLLTLYQTYGIYYPMAKSLQFKGKEGADQMKLLMETLRHTPPKEIHGKKVTLIQDYISRKQILTGSGKESSLTLPQSNVLLYRLDDDTKVVLRPSGTEPKLKIYAEVVDKELCSDIGAVKKRLSFNQSRVEELVSAVLALLKA
jgi:phosphomannomutase